MLHGIDACELQRYGALGPVEILVFGGGPIGLLFVAALAKMGQHPVLADPNPGRLKVGRDLGAAQTIEIARGGGQAEAVRAKAEGGKGYWIAIDCTGQPGVWSDAIELVRPGGLVNLFGGCAPGTSIPLDTHLVHYSELTLKGVYHHRPETFRRAIELLADPRLQGRPPHLRHTADRRRRRRASKHDAKRDAEGRHQGRCSVTIERSARGVLRGSHRASSVAIVARMRTRFLIPVLSAVLLTGVAIFSMARGAEVTAGDLTVSKAWARATPPGASTGAVYVTVENHGDSEDRIVSATSPAAKSTMVHETIEQNGVSTMRAADATVAPGATLEMKPGGMHIMLMGLAAPLKEGDSLTLNLVFEKAGPVTVEAPIGPIGSSMPPMEGMQ